MLVTQSDRNFYNEHKDEYTHIISIVCPDEKELVKSPNENHFVVKMWDVDEPLKNKFREYKPPCWIEVMSTICTPDVWLRNININKEDFRLLIHCDAGVSRSPAITLGVLWELSKYIFIKEPEDRWLKTYIEARKQWCKSLLDWNNSVGLCRYIDGNLNPGVKPNQAILKIAREHCGYFPW